MKVDELAPEEFAIALRKLLKRLLLEQRSRSSPLRGSPQVVRTNGLGRTCQTGVSSATASLNRDTQWFGSIRLKER